MESPAVKKPSLGGSIPTRRRAAETGPELIRTSTFDTPLPLVVQPGIADLDPVAWASDNLAWIEEKLLSHGGILFRSFNLDSLSTLERFATAITPHRINYVEGSSPRVLLGEKTYTSTEYPPEYFVSLHSELSYAHQWPGKIFFYCVTAPRQGGETPISDNRKVLKSLPPATRERFERKRVKYLRNLRGGRGAGLSWQTVFESNDRSFVEAYCREGGIEFRWKEDEGLWTSQIRPAVIRHPRTGEELWFNQADQWHPTNLGREIAGALLATTRESDLPIYACHGDDSPLDPADLDEVRAAVRREMVTFPWQQGDALVLDNMLVSHGRSPFSGPRKVAVTMGAPVRLDEVEEVR
jgi:alpha-ketoglutarate-dependent taurine dioxygenase